MTAVEELSLFIDLHTDLAQYGQWVAVLEYIQLQHVSLTLGRGWDDWSDEPRPRTLPFDLVQQFLPRNIRSMTLSLMALPKSQILRLGESIHQRHRYNYVNINIRVDSWPCLTNLALLNCYNISDMLFDFKSPKLTSLTFKDEDYISSEPSRQRFEALVSMLSRFNTLETLIVDSSIHRYSTDTDSMQFIAQGISFHSISLKSLTYFCTPFLVAQHNIIYASLSQEVNETYQSFANAVSSCGKLRELALKLWKGTELQKCKVGSTRCSLDNIPLTNGRCYTVVLRI